VNKIRPGEGGMMNILIVDDVVENLNLLQSLLESAGYAVVSSRNGKEAMTRLREGSFNLIVSGYKHR